LSQNIGKKLPYSPRNNPEERNSQIVLLIQVCAKGGANRKFITSLSLSLFFLSLGTEDILQKWIYSWHYVSSMFCHVQSYFSFLLS
jgi:hypothetical protein